MIEKQRNNTEQKADATGEFFSVGAPLHAVRTGYVFRSADQQLLDTLLNGENAHVIAPARSGKTSLVAAASAQLQSQGVRVALIDLAQISERDGGTDAGRWYYNIAYRIVRQLRLKTDLQAWWQDKSMVSNRQRLVEFYIEVVLRNIPDRIVIFIDEIQCIAGLPFAEHLLASIRAAHNSRLTDPEFKRLSFVLLGECDPQTLVSQDGLSPFNVSTQIRLADFSRDELDIFKAELNLHMDDAETALDSVYDWTGGQPYLTQKLARAISREAISGDVAEQVDRIARQQLAGRAALNSEPHMSRMHRAIVGDRKQSEGLLNLYGKMRKGVPVSYDPASKLQQKLFSLGLLVVDKAGKLAVRNRVYKTVFTATWANENLPIHWRGPAMALALVVAIAAVPFWYTQVLPRPYVRILSAPTTEIVPATAAYENLRTFPGHKRSADNLYRSFILRQAQAAIEPIEITRISNYASRMPEGDSFAAELVGDYWLRTLKLALRGEQRDKALMAALESMIIATPERRRVAANLVGDDYPQLIGTVPQQPADRVLYDADNNLLSFASGAQISQWSMSNNTIQQRAGWTITALEVNPLVRRQIVDEPGEVSSVSLEVGLAHGRLDDLRMKLIAPSGRAVELEIEASIAADNSIRFDSGSLVKFLGEPVSGTWSLSLRDESAAVPGSLRSWALFLNGKKYAELPDRNIDIPDPIARASNNIWFSDGGRYAVARAINSDSARLWDLLYAQPARAIAVPANERVLGVVGVNAEYLVTARQHAISLWRTSTGRRHSTLDIGEGNAELRLWASGKFLSLLRRGDAESEFELWSLEHATIISKLTVAGSPAQIALSSEGNILAIADYDRAIRVWDLASGLQVAQIDLMLPPTTMTLSPSGDSLGVTHSEQGLSMWKLATPGEPLLLERGRGDWQLAFSPSGSSFIAGNSRDGFQVFRSSDGAIVGPPIGTELNAGSGKLLAFSNDENYLVTAGPGDIARFWYAPVSTSVIAEDVGDHELWRESGDSIMAIAPGGRHLAIGDADGHVHILRVDSVEEELANARNEVSFIGHRARIIALSFSIDGSLVASISVDGAVRVWDAHSGLPRPFSTLTSTTIVDDIQFSPSGSYIAVLAGQRIWIMNSDNGRIVADLDLGGKHSGLAFASDTQLYLGSESGALQSIAADRTDSWNLRTLWQGENPLRSVAVSAGRGHLIIVDDHNNASLLNVQDGRLGASVLQLPDSVRDIVFSPNETRVLFRTARWVHRAGVYPSGLIWIDAIRAPKGLSGGKLVLDSGTGADGLMDPLGGSAVLLTRDTGFAEVAELRFAAKTGPLLIGPREQLIEEWRRKLGLDGISQ